MPALYEKIRDECYKRKEKKKGKLTDKDKKECKRMAAITYYKQTGKPVSHTNADLSLSDELPDQIELDIMLEQLDFFGSFKSWENWNKSIELEEDKND